MFDKRLALMTGIDFPIIDSKLLIHQPTIKEISYVGENLFFQCVQVICIDKKELIQDKSILEDTSNFQIFMTVINNKESNVSKESIINILNLFFPNYTISLTPVSIIFVQEEIFITIDESNFHDLQQIIKTICCIKKDDQITYNPKDDKAKEIAEKIMRGRKRVAESKSNQGSMFSLYLSVITVGIGSMTLQQAIQLTIYQLQDLMERYSLYINWDLGIKAKLAGSEDKTPVENWMKNIH